MSVAKAEIRITILRVYGIDAQDFVLRWGSGLLDGHISFELDLLIALRRVVWHAAIAFGQQHFNILIFYLWRHLRPCD